jgi:hypothetical protein
MPRYHFAFTRPDGVVLFDEGGTDLPDLAAAKAHARLVIRAVQKDAAPDHDWSEWIAAIKGTEDDEFAVIRFKDVIGLRVA